MNGDPEPYLAYFEEGDPVEALGHDYQELTALGRVAWNPRYDVELDRRLARITCPALVLTPDEDRLIPHEHFTRFAELLPNARLVAVSGADRPTGHLLIIQEPEALAATIADSSHRRVSRAFRPGSSVGAGHDPPLHVRETPLLSRHRALNAPQLQRAQRVVAQPAMHGESRNHAALSKIALRRCALLLFHSRAPAVVCLTVTECGEEEPAAR